MKAELPAQSSQLFPIVGLSQDRVGGTPCAAKSRDQSTDSRDFDLRRCIADQIDIASGHPSPRTREMAIRRYARGLHLHGFQAYASKKSLQFGFGSFAVLSDEAHCRARLRLWNQPV